MKRIPVCLILFCLLVLGGCGGGSSAPAGSVLAMNPADVTLSDSGASLAVRTQHYTVSIKDAAGRTLGNTKVTLSALLADSGYMQFYDAAGNAVNSPFDAETDNFGVYNFTIQFVTGNGLSYFGDIEARSGEAYATTKLTVNTATQ